jgi:hypothetical protein
MSQSLVDHVIEVGSELVRVDAHAGARQLRDLVAGDEGALAGPQGPELGDRFAVARHHTGFASRYGLDHLRVLVAQLTLCIGVWARNTAHRTQRRYLLANWRRLTTVLPRTARS